MQLVRGIVCAWSRFDRHSGPIVVKSVVDGVAEETPVSPPFRREPFQAWQIL